MMQLRPYQSLAIDKLASKVGAGKRKIIFQLATGGGKTVSFAGLIERYLKKHQRKVLILVHREELLIQAYRTLFNGFDIIAAPITAESKYLPNVMVCVAMVETANNLLKNNPKYFGNIGLVIIDECHIGNFKKLFEYFNDSLIIGFTATPISGSKKDPLKNHYEDIVCGIDIPDLIKQGSLCENRTYHIKNVKRNELAIKNGEFDERQMGELFGNAKHVHNTINAYKEHSYGKKTIIFNCNIDHSKKVCNAFNSFGYESRHLDGETPSHLRTATLKWFKETPGAILHNVGILTTGFDEPSVLSVIVNKSTMSLPLWLQITGRGSRPFEGKEYFTIIDMGGNALVHGDWCDNRDWAYTFFNPEKPKTGGEAPTKVCVGCDAIIHASIIICRLCGGNNKKSAIYDENVIIKFELLEKERPLNINVAGVIAEYAGKIKSDGTAYKDTAAIHAIKMRIINHITRVWRLRKIDEKVASEIVLMFQNYIKEWCILKGIQYGYWYAQKTKEWMYAEFDRVFKSDNKKIA
jgi:superfamily II DNA or RNA helicase